MKTKSKILTKLLSGAVVALSCAAALAQTNTLPTTYVFPVSAANTNRPGFIWNLTQVTANPGTLDFVESMIAGLQGTNLADPNNIASSAAAPATVSTNPFAPFSFSVPGVINMSINGPGDSADARADLPAEDSMIGIPGLTGSTADFAGEALTYLDLPAGLVTMGVRSDDGFRLQVGAANPADRYSTNAVILEQFNGGRGFADSIVSFFVAKSGLYAARLLYEQAGSSASVEWYSFPTTGTNYFLPTTANPYFQTFTNGVPNIGGTNAVLINDTADGGIPAYQAVNLTNGSYVSILLPIPNTSGVSPFPKVAAQIVNGLVPVSNITLSLNGVTVTPTITTTSQGAAVSFTETNVLAANSFNTLSLSWMDNGTPLDLSWSFTTAGYVSVSPPQAVNPDTTKPGFLFNVFEHYLDVTAGENDFYDNIEQGLNGLLAGNNFGLENGGIPAASGSGLPNDADVTATNIALGMAPALTAPGAPAEFQVASAIALTNGLPGVPGVDGGSKSHSEVLTYVALPAGLTTFTVNLDGYYRAFVGSWDYTLGLEAGAVFNTLSGSANFYVYAASPGYYPLRLTYLNLDGTPTLSLSTLGANGSSVLVGDTAHGGLAAYRAVSGQTSSGQTSKPYVRYTNPRNVPHQMTIPSQSVLIRIQDGATPVNDTTPALTLDGKAVPIATNRVGNVLELSYTPTTLQIPTETHSAVLTYKDAAGDSLTNTWTFMNLKATWLPTNVVDIETFDTYADPTEFTNTPAGTNWFVWNYDASEGAAEDAKFDPTDANSQAYANFLCVDPATFAKIEGDSASVAPFEYLNGQPITQLASGNILIAESDNRNNNSPGQVQFALSRRFNLSRVTNAVVAWSSIYKQNQDNITSVDYTLDGGVTYHPVIIYLDGGEFSDAGDPPDIKLNPDGSVNAALTLTNSSYPPHWTGTNSYLHTTYGDGVASPITPALGPFFAPRINDDKTEAKRLEVVRLPLAGGQSDVRFRFSQLGTCSWYSGLDNLAIYDIPLSGAMVPSGVQLAVNTPVITSIAPQSGGSIKVTWTGGTLQSTTSLSAPNWQSINNSGTYTETIAGVKFFRVTSP